MSLNRALLFIGAFLVAFCMVGMTCSQTVAAENCNAVSAGSPRLGSSPTQPPQGLSPSAWSRITHQVRASRYDLVRRAGTDDRVVEADSVLGTADAGYAVWVATHPNLNLEYEFDKRGMRVQPHGAEQDAWNWGLQLVGLGGEYGLQAVGPVSPHVERNRVEYRRPGLLEWYTHDRRGVEQGFTIESVPTGATGRMRVEFTVSGTLAAELTSSGEGVMLRDAEGGTALRYDELYAFDASGRDLPVWMELREKSGRERHLALWVDIREADFPVTIDPVISTQVAKMTASDAAAGDEFGTSVSISGDTVVIGARYDTDAGFQSGSAYIFQRDAGGADNWGELAKLTASDAGAGDQFGWSVSISGDTVVVGAPQNDNFAGTAYIFERNAGGAENWGQVKKVTASDADFADFFGRAVSIGGDTVVVGASRNDDVFEATGSAYVFERNAGGAENWGEVKKLGASDPAAFALFGRAVAVSGDRVVVGAPRQGGGGDLGAGYIFERNAGGAENWGEVKKVTASDAVRDSHLGQSVSISADTVIIGALEIIEGRDTTGSGYIFERNAGGADNWGEVAKLTTTVTVPSDGFGISVSISGDMAVVGANGVNGYSGAAYVFRRGIGGVDNWGQLGALNASDVASGDSFARSVSISDDTVFVGAPANDDAGLDSGSGYIFTISGCTWQSITKVVASDPAAEDEFGTAVSISGDTVVVGAPWNLDANVSGGAAFVYWRNAGGAATWGQVAKLTASIPGDLDGFGDSVFISGDTVVVGAPGDDDAGSLSGSAYVYQRDAGGTENWGQVAKLAASDAAAGDEFGRSVSINSNTILIGVPFDDDAGHLSGSAYVYGRDAGGQGNWGQVAKLTASDAAAGDRLGLSVSVSGDTVVVGAPFEDFTGGTSSVGSAYVFERNAGGLDSWGEVAKLIASDAAFGDRFGYSVSISGDTTVVGVPSDLEAGTRSGSAHVYGRNAGGQGGWGEETKLVAADAADGDQFGRSVAISGDTVVIGAHWDADASYQSGSAYIFERNARGADSWGEVAKLTASDAGYRDQFGGSVAISGARVIAGAFGDNDGGSNSGSAYTFEFSCAVCGDSLVESPEECDAGIGNSDVMPDACRTSCKLPACGDLVVDTGEECDDGNLTDNDGCDSNCTDTGCGNGIVTAPEECDDGNTARLDGCDRKCRLECLDIDGDGFGFPATECTGGGEPDCDDDNSLLWGTPGEVLGVLFASETVMTWDPPTDPGGTVVIYDVLRSPVEIDFSIAAAICVESDDGVDTMATDETVPNPGTVFHYLVRAQNACPVADQGPVGTQSDGTLRIGRSCP